MVLCSIQAFFGLLVGTGRDGLVAQASKGMRVDRCQEILVMLCKGAFILAELAVLVRLT